MRPALVLEPLAEINLGSYRSKVGEASLRQRLYTKQGRAEQCKVTKVAGSFTYLANGHGTSAEHNVISLAQLPRMASKKRDSKSMGYCSYLVHA